MKLRPFVGRFSMATSFTRSSPDYGCFDDGGSSVTVTDWVCPATESERFRFSRAPTLNVMFFCVSLAKPGCSTSIGVGTYRQDGEGEEAVGIASGLKVDTGRAVGSHQLGAGKSGTGLIDDDAFDGALIPWATRRARLRNRQKGMRGNSAKRAVRVSERFTAISP